MERTLTRTVPSEERVRLLAKLFRGLGDPTRLAILEALRAGEQRVVDLVGTVGRAQPNVSSHLACLRDCGLVVSRPSGRETYYALADERMEDVLLAADGILDRVKGLVCGCERYEEGACDSGA